MFNFSDYPPDLKFFDLVNKNVIGKMKDKSKAKTISKFVGLKSKIFSLVFVDGKENKKQKESMKILLQTQDMNNFLIFCSIKN